MDSIRLRISRQRNSSWKLGIHLSVYEVEKYRPVGGKRLFGICLSRLKSLEDLIEKLAGVPLPLRILLRKRERFSVLWEALSEFCQ